MPFGGWGRGEGGGGWRRKVNSTHRQPSDSQETPAPTLWSKCDALNDQARAVPRVTATSPPGTPYGSRIPAAYATSCSEQEGEQGPTLDTHAGQGYLTGHTRERIQWGGEARWSPQQGRNGGLEHLGGSMGKRSRTHHNDQWDQGDERCLEGLSHEGHGQEGDAQAPDASHKGRPAPHHSSGQNTHRKTQSRGWEVQGRDGCASSPLRTLAGS